jgi:DNA-binding transcriptional MerR regulator
MKTESRSQLLKMADLARRSGVPAATIKHYIREGLLPAPAARNGRTMAWYDASMVGRINAIKKLQSTRFLPLKVIKGLLDDQGPAALAATEDAISSVLRRLAPVQSASRDMIIEAGMSATELDWLCEIGVVSPNRDGGKEQYDGDDLVMLKTLQAARDAGITREMLPPQILESYLAAVQALVRMELNLFHAGVLAQGGERLTMLAETATVLSEQLVVLLRRKLLLPTLRQLVQEELRPQSRRASRPPARSPSRPPAPAVARKPRKGAPR